ncbi:GntR family transcriptional regulator [Kribbella sp. NPDC051952]|uniref:GntR family transcriptional regulator n=1 Tax=Kribbella sp. NPDC051952 TaxID=3154851 RepID=UPI003427E140
MSEAPYQAIAGEIRARIVSGELKPGERVPSTRALVRDFGVAMATATKALQTLQQERLVHASPGVGTVVGPPPRRSGVRAAQPEGIVDLNRAEVVRIGIELADAEGLAALSMRRIAAELGVSTMALYRHVGGKDALVLQMVDHALGEFPLAAAPKRWRDAVADVARVQWAAYRRHLWLASAISLGRPQLLPNLLPHTDAVLRALARVDKTEALYAAISVFAYVRGVALTLEAEEQAEQDTGLTADEWADRQAEQMATLVAAGNLTGFRALLADDFDFDYNLDRLFEFGLELVLDGMKARFARLR